MKKSQLKEIIKSSLKEDNKQGSVKLKKGTPDSEIKKYTTKGIDVELNESSDIKDMKLSQVMKLVKDGGWETDIDIVPYKHVILKNRISGKQKVVNVRPDKVAEGKFALMKNSSSAARAADTDQSDVEYIITRQQRDKISKELFNKNYKELDQYQKSKVEAKRRSNISEGNSDFEGSGLIVVGKTQIDNNKIQDLINDEEYHAIWNSKEGYWFFPEEESTLDQLEADLEAEFYRYEINARFESQLDEAISQADADLRWNKDRMQRSSRQVNSDNIIAAKKYKEKENNNNSVSTPQNNVKTLSSSTQHKIKQLEKEREQLMFDMEQEAEPEGGPIADRYGKQLDRIDRAIAKLKGINKSVRYHDVFPEDRKFIKKSELKEIIKKTLSEENNTELTYLKQAIEMAKEGFDIDSIYTWLEEQGLSYSEIESTMNQVEDFILKINEQDNSDSIDEKLKKWRIVNPYHIKMIESGYGEFPDAYGLTQKGIETIKSFFNPSDNINEQEDEEVEDNWNKAETDDTPSDSDLDKQALKNAKASKGKGKKLDFIIKELEALKKEMISMVKNWKEETDPIKKQKLMTTLKKKQEIRNELEAQKEKLASKMV